MPCRLIVDTPKQSSRATRRTGSALAAARVRARPRQRHLTAHHSPSHIPPPPSRRSLAHTSQCSLAHTSPCPLSPSQRPLPPSQCPLSSCSLAHSHTHSHTRTRTLAPRTLALARSPHTTHITPHGQSLGTSSVPLDRLCSPPPLPPHTLTPLAAARFNRLSAAGQRRRHYHIQSTLGRATEKIPSPPRHTRPHSTPALPPTPSHAHSHTHSHTKTRKSQILPAILSWSWLSGRQHNRSALPPPPSTHTHLPTHPPPSQEVRERDSKEDEEDGGGRGSSLLPLPT